MTDTTKTFHQRLRDSRPDVVEHQKKNGKKRAIAIKLRDLRASATCRSSAIPGSSAS